MPTETTGQNRRQRDTAPLKLEELPELLTLEQVGAVMGRSYQWVAYTWIPSPDFPSDLIDVRTIGRTKYIAKAELAAWLNGKAA